MQRSMPLALVATLALSSVSRADPPDTSEDIAIDASGDEAQIALSRKKKKGSGKVSMQDFHFVMRAHSSSASLFLSKPGQGEGPKIDLDVVLAGADAATGGLLYVVATLGGDPNALEAVQDLGYDVEVVKEHSRPCTDLLPTETCVELAQRLATLIDATLPLGSSDERDRFRQDAAALGFGSDCSQGEPPCTEDACPEPQ